MERSVRTLRPGRCVLPASPGVRTAGPGARVGTRPLTLSPSRRRPTAGHAPGPGASPRALPPRRGPLGDACRLEGRARAAPSRSTACGRARRCRAGTASTVRQGERSEGGRRGPTAVAAKRVRGRRVRVTCRARRRRQHTAARGGPAAPQPRPGRPQFAVEHAESPDECPVVDPVLAALVHQGQGVAEVGGVADERLRRTEAGVSVPAAGRVEPAEVVERVEGGVDEAALRARQRRQRLLGGTGAHPDRPCASAFPRPTVTLSARPYSIAACASKMVSRSSSAAMRERCCPG